MKEVVVPGNLRGSFSAAKEACLTTPSILRDAVAWTAVRDPGCRCLCLGGGLLREQDLDRCRQISARAVEEGAALVFGQAQHAGG
jgi:hypothetical protein